MTVGFDKAAWFGEKKLVDERLGASRLIGDLSLLDLGCLAWSIERRTAGDEAAVGGVIVAKTQRVEEETGEIVRTFVTVDPYKTRPGLRWRTLTPAEIDRHSMELPQDGLLRSLVRRLAEEISTSKGPFTPQIIEFDRWQHTLVGVLAGLGAVAA